MKPLLPQPQGNDQAATVYDELEFVQALKEQAKRECEALRIYEPMPHQDEFHKSNTHSVLMVKGNQVGGTVAGAIELARAVTGQDPYNKYPKKDGVAVCLGYGEKHIGKVFYPYLFKEGAFDMIRDLVTGQWRVYRPWPAAKGGDLERALEIAPAPPLIPARFLAEPLAWEKRSERIFSVARFTTGWELFAFNSAGDPGQAQGFKCNLFWIDEDLATSGWLAEANSRLLKRRGLLRWTALPHGKNDDMMTLLEDGEKQEREPPNRVTTKVIHVTTHENKFIAEEALQDLIQQNKALGEDVYQQRIMGRLSLDSIRMYPTFSRMVHSSVRDDDPMLALHKVLAERGGEPPDDWCRYMSTDPGHSVAASIMLAVPPPEQFGDYVVAFDEVYVRSATAETWGEAVNGKCSGRTWRGFIIDEHGGALREIGSGVTPREHYQRQLIKHNLVSEICGSNFISGCDKVEAREECLRSWLSINREGFPKLFINLARCPTLVWEIERFKKLTAKVAGRDVPIDKGQRRANTHACEALEMLAAHGCEYVKPTYRPVSHQSYAERLLAQIEHRDLKRRSRLGSHKSFVSLAPIGSQP